MTSFFTMSSFKRRRFNLSAKSFFLCNIAETRVKFKTFFQAVVFNKASQVAVFDKASQAAVFDQRNSNKDVQRRISYIKKQKLVVINYVTITIKTQKNESTRLINKYVATKNLDIVLIMFRN